MKKFLLAALLIAVASLAGPALAAPQRASLPDIEDEVMCPTCGVPLALAFSPQAERERQFIRDQIDQGRTKEQIKDALVAEFGAEVLAMPDTDDSSFNWAAYLVPVAAFVVAAAAIALALRRWSARAATAADAAPPPPDLSPSESARLEQDLTRYDL
jgi:cytochrome c-type biogenesis protein CcmH